MNANPARRFLAALVAVPLVALVAITTLFLAGNAHADAPPAPGTPECTALVSADATVKTAQGTVDSAQAAVDGAGVNVTEALNTALADAKLTLSTAQKSASKLCTGTTAPSTTPTSTSTPPPADDKNCSDFATQADAQAFYDSVKTAAVPDPDHLDANGNGKACEDAADGSGKVVTGVKAPSAAPSTTAKTATSTPIVSDPATSTGTGTGAVVPNTSAGVNTGGNDW